MKVFFVILTAVFVSLSFTGCKQKKELEIVLPVSLNGAVQEDWAVIQEPYAAFYDEPDADSGIAAHARRGDVLQVKGRKIDDDRQIWIKEPWNPWGEGLCGECKVAPCRKEGDRNLCCGGWS